MALTKSAFIYGQEQQNGLAGYLAVHFRGWGTATVLSGQTAIVVTDTEIKTGDIIIASVITKGTNACYVVGTAITNVTSFTITVNTDPGVGGAVIGYLIIRA
jgi:hypothetical protein